MNKTVNTSPEPVKVRSSIARKLSSRLFFRLFGIFLSLDIMLCCIACVSIVIFSERSAANAATLILASETTRFSGENLPEISGITIDAIIDGPDGFRIIKPFSYILPPATADCHRSVETTGAPGAVFSQRLDTFRYNIFLEKGAFTYKISVELGTFLHFFRLAFTALLVYELLVLISRLIKDRKIVRKTLEPISALAEAAKNINQAGGLFDTAKMAALAGKLEGINASRLDTRIQVDDTQEELKSIALAINGMLDRINDAYRAQVRFVSDASHELRTPISVIQGYANLLDRWGKNDEKTLQESISAIKDEAANMKDLVEQLLFLARGDNNTIKLQLEDINLSELAAEVVHETQMIDKAHNFDVRGTELIVSADRSLLKQALRILIDNAIKYTDSGGSITVTTQRENDFAKISVADDGIGISPEFVPQIFDRFYRADESRARATGGAGLGLSIANWISGRHGGHLEVISREGIGTKIMIALPVSAQPAKPEDSCPTTQTAEQTI